MQSACKYTSTFECRIRAAIGCVRSSRIVRNQQRSASLANLFLCRPKNGTELLIFISDEAGKIDLNTAPLGVLIGLFELVTDDTRKAQALARAILDFRDSDDIVNSAGAESKENARAGLGRRPKNAAFVSMKEAEQVVGDLGP